MSKEQGAASILIDLNSGNITVYHGTEQDQVLLSRKNVPTGTWNAIWSLLKSINEEEQDAESNRARLEAMTTEEVGKIYEATIGYNPINESLSRKDMIGILVDYPERVEFPNQ